MPDLAFTSLRAAHLGGVDGEFRRGRVSAILGPSGAGKTTLLSVLAGRVPRTGGAITLDGEPADLRELRQLLGFATEEDALLPLLTTEETLDFAAAARLPSSVTRADRAVLVDRILHVLGLTHIRRARVGSGTASDARGISFGERRRLSIGVELVVMPEVLFVDDATCGLDSRTAREVVWTLSRVAAAGLTVAAILHQPSWRILERVDDVLCLARGGRTAFCGPADEALAYFDGLGFACPPGESPAAYLISLLGGTPSLTADEAARAAGPAAEAAAAASAATAAPPAVPADALEASRAGGDAEELLASLAALWTQRWRASSSAAAAAADGGGGGGGAAAARRWGEAPRPPAGFVAQLRLWTTKASVLALRRWRKTTLDFALLPLVGLLAGIANVEAQFVGPLPDELRGACISYFTWGAPAAQRTTIEALCSANLRDSMRAASQYLVVTLSLASLATMAGTGFSVGERRAHRLGAMGWRQALAFFVGTDASRLPWVVLSPLPFLVIYTHLVPLRLVWDRWYVAVCLLLWSYAGVAYTLQLLFGYYRAFPVGIVFCCSMFAFDGVSIPPEQWGALRFVPALTINRWAIRLLYDGVVENYQPPADGDAAAEERRRHAYAMMLALGVGWRAVAFACLRRRTRQSA